MSTCFPDSTTPPIIRRKRPRVVYLRDDSATRYEFSVQSPQHPMKPWRLTAVHAVTRRLGLFPSVSKKRNVLQVMTPPPMPADLMKDFHLPQYVADLEKASGDCWKYIPTDAMSNTNEWIPLQQRPQVVFADDNQQKPVNNTSNQVQTENPSSSTSFPTTAAGTTQQQPNLNTSSHTNTNASNNIQHEPAPSCYSAFDCPPVQGGLEYSQKVAGSSLFGAVLLNAGAADTVVNWNGGMHHARAGTCSGFCYANDCVIAIRELLRAHDRVLYVDLDVHHGDGVEEAFYDTDRVFTLSLHKFADGFFPGTGHPADVGVDRGRYFSMNIPLRDGIRDGEYLELFHTAFGGIVRAFRPAVVVVQCGADSLAGDRLGGTCLRLSSAGHAACVRAVRDSGVAKILALGGGGYAVRNVARLWAFETAVLCGCDEEEGFWDDDGDDDDDGGGGGGDRKNIDDDDDAGSRGRKVEVPRITSRSLFSLPDAASVLNFFSSSSSASAKNEKSDNDGDDDDEDCRNVLRKLITCADSEELQIKLEERALLLIFPESATVENNNSGNSTAQILDVDDDSNKTRQNYVNLYVSCDDGGYEVRQSYASTLSAGGGAVVIQRFMQTTLKRINEHLNYLNQQMMMMTKEE